MSIPTPSVQISLDTARTLHQLLRQTAVGRALVEIDSELSRVLDQPVPEPRPVPAPPIGGAE